MAASATGARNDSQDLTTTEAIGLLGQHERWPTLDLPAANSALADQQPWRAYWSARLQMGLAPSEAREIYAAAMDRFDALHERAGASLALAALIETYYVDETALHPLDDWVGELQSRLASDEPTFQPEVLAQVMACGLAITLRDQAHPMLARWANQGLALLRQLAPGAPRLKLATFLLQYHCWRGELGPATLIVDALPNTTPDGLLPSEAVVWYESVANHGRFTARHDQARRAIDAALQLLVQHDLKSHHYALHAHATAMALAAEDEPRAAAHLQAMRQVLEQQALADQTHYWHLHCGWYLLRGDSAQALASAQMALANSQEIGGPYRTAVHQCSLAIAWLAHGDDVSAVPLLQAAVDGADAIGAALLSFTARLWLSQALQAAQNSHASVPFAGPFTPEPATPADSPLRQALAIAAVQDFACTAIWPRPDWLAQRLARALALGIEPNYVRRLIRRSGLRCPDPHLRQWPWPLSIHAFGEWRVVRGEEAELPAGARAQQRPFDLLRVLMANDANALPVSTVLQWLWPESEYDAQRRAFDAALSRLRKLLGDDSLLRLDGGQLQLDRSRAWSDVGSAASLMGQIEQADDLPSRKALASALLDLVRGPLLPGIDDPWVTAARERHRRRFVMAITRLAEGIEADAPIPAARLYERALDADPLAESLHRRLMQLHAVRGEHGEALRAWRHCQAVLATSAGLQPSAESRTLAKRLGLI